MIRYVFAISLIVVILMSGCGAIKEVNTVRDKPLKIDYVNENDMDFDKDSLSQIKENIQLQIDTINNGDLKGFSKLFTSGISPDDEYIIEEIIKKESKLTLNEVGIVYQKDGEILAHWSGKLMTKVYDEGDNYNQLNDTLVIFKKVNNKWKALTNYDQSIKVLYLDGKGNINSNSEYKNYNSLWLSEIKRLKKEKLLPTIWMNKVRDKLLNEE